MLPLSRLSTRLEESDLIEVGAVGVLRMRVGRHRVRVRVVVDDQHARAEDDLDVLGLTPDDVIVMVFVMTGAVGAVVLLEDPEHAAIASAGRKASVRRTMVYAVMRSPVPPSGAWPDSSRARAG